MKLRDFIECLDDDCLVMVENYNNARLIEHGEYAGDIIPDEQGDDNTTLLCTTVRMLKTYPKFYTPFLELEVTNLKTDGACSFDCNKLSIDLTDNNRFQEIVMHAKEKAWLEDDE